MFSVLRDAVRMHTCLLALKVKSVAKKHTVYFISCLFYKVSKTC